MDLKILNKKIDKNKSTKIHNYYQKVLLLLFTKQKDPFNRRVKEIDVEKKVGKGLADVYIKWEYNGKEFDEIIEVELQGRKKNLLNKIKLYGDKADLFSLCIPSKKLTPLMTVFSKMKKDLPNINIVYLMDDDQIRKNRRKIVQDQKLVVGAHSPFMLMNMKNKFKDVREFVNSKRYFFFDALLPLYLK